MGVAMDCLSAQMPWLLQAALVLLLLLAHMDLACLQPVNAGAHLKRCNPTAYRQTNGCTSIATLRPPQKARVHRSLQSSAATAQAMSSEDGYSLWLEPVGPIRDCLAQEISQLAQQHKHLDAPVFPPHVTLLGLLQQPQEKVLETAQDLASKLKAYRIRFQDVACGTFYYQCVFLRAHDDPDTMHAAALARQLFNKETRPYMPHLSLLYADISDEQKEEVAAVVRQRLFGQGQAFEQLGGAEFVVGKISVWYTPTGDRSCASWKRVAEFPLLE